MYSKKKSDWLLNFLLLNTVGIYFFKIKSQILSTGPISDEHIAHKFSDNRDPIVRELTDDNFEHLTQAASGATTGK